MNLKDRLWVVICELSSDEDRRAFAQAILERRPYVVNSEAVRAEIEKARAILLGMRDLSPWAALLGDNRAFAILLDVHSPEAASVLSWAARRAAGVGEEFRNELVGMRLAPVRRGRRKDRLAGYLADNVVLAYRRLTGEAPPLGDPYDAARPVSESSLYRLGEAAFRAHGLPWYASRIQDAAQRAAAEAELPPESSK